MSSPTTITHDLPAASDADQIVILESGRVVEQGDPDELMARSPRYRRLLEMKRGPRPLSRAQESGR